jgi:hypothetical protein
MTLEPAGDHENWSKKVIVGREKNMCCCENGAFGHFHLLSAASRKEISFSFGREV